MPWAEYYGGQRNAVLYGALYEGLAADAEDADAKLSDGRITLAATHDHGCVGSVAGIYTASMPVFVVENTRRRQPRLLQLLRGRVAAPAELRLLQRRGPARAGLPAGRARAGAARGHPRHQAVSPLKPLIGRALRMGDELHSRNTAATTLFTRELTPQFIEYAVRSSKLSRR